MSHYFKQIFILLGLAILLNACSNQASLHESASSVDASKQAVPVVNQWSNIPKSKDVKGIALVAHGLNQKPNVMQSVIDRLNGEGVETLNLTLSGHDMANLGDEQRLKSFKSVTYIQWRGEVYQAFKAAKKRAEENKVPLFFVGYSLGGLLGCDLIASRSDVSFERMVLFAPALSIHYSSQVLEIFSSFPNIVIPSFSPEEYRANAGTPIGAYNALYEAIDHFENNLTDRINIPTILFIDESDELVSYTGLLELIHTQNLTHWQVEPIKKGDDARTHYSHLIVDAPSVGSQQWEHMLSKMVRLLSDA